MSNEPVRRLAPGGSAAPENTGLGGTEFLKTNVPHVFLSQKTKAFKAKILPARDSSLSYNDTAYPTSVRPYRDASLPMDELTKSPGFTPWFTWFLGYKMFGHGKHNIASPLSLTMFDPKSRCPIADCYTVAKSGMNKDWATLTEKVKSNNSAREYAVLSRPKNLCLMNIYYEDERTHQWKVGVVVLNSVCLEHLKKQLSWPTPMNSTILDASWKDFVLGDVTNPDAGLVGTIYMGQVAQMSSHLFQFSDREGFNDGARPGALAGAKDYALRNRQDIWDYDNGVFNILSYQEIVDILVADGAVPYALIQYACSSYANIPPEPKRSAVTPTAAAPADGSFGAAPGGYGNAPGSAFGQSPGGSAPAATPPAAFTPAPPVSAPAFPAAGPAPGGFGAAPGGFGTTPAPATQAADSPAPAAAAPAAPVDTTAQDAANKAEYATLRGLLMGGQPLTADQVARFTELSKLAAK